MKKILCGVVCAIGFMLAGCDMDVPVDDVDSMTNIDFCGLTGGDYDWASKRCSCGGILCGEGVGCTKEQGTGAIICNGYAHKPFPSGTCITNDETICNEIAESNQQAIGYYVTCTNNVWSDIKPCPNGNSCQYSKDVTGTVTTACGECKNGQKCVNGRSIQSSGPSN